VERLGKLTRQLESTVGRLLGSQPGDSSEPLELVTGILRDVEQRIEPTGGGRRRFPYTHVSVIVLTPQKEDQDRCAAALEDLDTKIRERLAELACEPPARLDISLQFARKPRKHWAPNQHVELQFSRDARDAGAGAAGSSSARSAVASTAAARTGAADSPSRLASTANATDAADAAALPAASTDAAAPALPTVRVAILRGSAIKRAYALRQAVIRLGRGAEHADAVGGTRHNDIAFADDDDEVNRTVARAQAHLRFNPERGEYRLFDDGSSNGTRIVRNAEIITITPHGPRGVRIASGDILELGRARLRVDLEP
jgi:hypothetical protein